MKILILGSGGREHALAWRLSQDSSVETIQVLPGNPGMLNISKLELIPGHLEVGPGLVTLIKGLDPDLILIGPEAPLCGGLVDDLVAADLPVLGPLKACAMLEGSKVFSKQFMRDEGIPTSDFEAFDSYADALAFIETRPWKGDLVIKASELAAGKGVVVSRDLEVQKQTLHNFLQNPDYEVKAREVVIEQRSPGVELSVFALCDGEDFLWLSEVRDHKRLLDGDLGPNTGGMGCYTHPGMLDEKMKEKVIARAIKPVLEGMKKRGTPFKGFLFIGLMIHGDDFHVLEYNVRLGDPETQTFLPLLKGDLGETLRLAANGLLKGASGFLWRDHSQSALHIVMASKNYPSLDGTPLLVDQPISFDDGAARASHAHSQIFFAGVKRSGENLVNAGGRVLGVTAWAATLEESRMLAYEELKKIRFNGAFYRKDLGLKTS